MIAVFILAPFLGTVNEESDDSKCLSYPADIVQSAQGCFRPSICIRIVSAARTPHVVAIGHFDIVHHAHDEADVPGVGRLARERGCRPIVGYLNVGEGMTYR